MAMFEQLGIIGHGVVGSALRQVFSEMDIASDFLIHDPAAGFDTPLSALSLAPLIFVCVPTPMMPNGIQDISIISDTLGGLDEINYDGVVVIKSTTTPMNVLALAAKYPKLRLVTNPEFLTQRTAIEDFRQQPFIIVGGEAKNTSQLTSIYFRNWPKSPLFATTAAAAMMIKYVLNSYFASKIAFLNECYKLWEQIGDTSWKNVIDGFTTDTRAGVWHADIPGPDGHFGFGGKCFPKDLHALIHMAELAGTPRNVMQGAWATNEEVREDRDWESIPGAITKADETE